MILIQEEKLAYSISNECNACGICEPECPVQAILPGEEKYYIDPDECTDCGLCEEVCPVDAIYP
jgi:NAD-dependent dihydropyrimidine dehydrogenase PreA subunit